MSFFLAVRFDALIYLKRIISFFESNLIVLLCKREMISQIIRKTAFLFYAEKRTNGSTLYSFATNRQTLLLTFSVVCFSYFTIIFDEYNFSNFLISSSKVSGVVAYKALGIIISLSLGRFSLL